MESMDVFRSCRHVLLVCAFLPAVFGQDAATIERDALQQWADGHQTEAVSMFRKAIPLVSGRAQARVLNLIGEMERLAGRASAAELLHRRAVEVDSLAMYANNLAEDLRTLRRYKEAEKYYAQAITTAAAVGEWSAELAIYLSNSACNRVYDRRYREAIPQLEQANRIWERIGESRIVDAAVTWNNLGLAYAHLKQYREAEVWYGKCREVWEQKLDPADLRMGLLYYDLGDLYVKQKRFGEAEELMRLAVQTLSGNSGVGQHYYAVALQQYAALLKKLGRGEAEAFKAQAEVARRNDPVAAVESMTVSVQSLR